MIKMCIHDAIKRITGESLEEAVVLLSDCPNDYTPREKCNKVVASKSARYNQFIFREDLEWE